MAALNSPQIVTFRVGDDTFAADVFSVERVIEYQRPMPVPSAPEWIEGIIEYQSRVVPAINLRRRRSFAVSPANTFGEYSAKGTISPFISTSRGCSRRRSGLFFGRFRTTSRRDNFAKD